MTVREWYFVRRVHAREAVGLKRFEVQRLNEDGQAIEVGYVGIEDTQLVLPSGTLVPYPVIAAAQAREEGYGEYVDLDGHVVPPF